MRYFSWIMRGKLGNLPVGSFAMVLGYAGLTISFQRAEAAFGLAADISELLTACTFLVFISLATMYAAKLALYWRSVCAEFEDPISVHFFPTISMSLILLSNMISKTHVPAAKALFFAGVPLHFILTIAVLHLWFTREHFEVTHVNPAWLIPAVGNGLVPIAGVNLGFLELSWFFFSIGIVFWVVLLPMIIQRMLFRDPLTEQYAPTLFILLAPPAVIFSSYVMLTGVIDAIARVFYYFGLFTGLFLITQVPRLARIKFSLSWWAYSFPVAAITGASWLMHEKTHSESFLDIAIGLQALLGSLMIFLTVRTVARSCGFESQLWRRRGEERLLGAGPPTPSPPTR